MGKITIVAFAAILCFILVGVVRLYALRSAVIDYPSERGSHSTPTPRGGGLGLIIATVTLWLLGSDTWISGTSMVLVGITVVTAVGWLDDHVSVPVGQRLMCHLIAGLCMMPLLTQPIIGLAWMGWGAPVWWLFWIISTINVVNFMDGIDGLVGSQMLVYAVHLAVLGIEGESAHTLGLGLAGGCVGFLAWNWPPARVFLGDVGSGGLGLIAVLGGLLLLREGSMGLLAVFLPLYPIFLDATVTLVRRITRGEDITSPHRTHLYQRLANGGWGHAKVTSLYTASASVGLLVAHAESHGAWPVILLSYVLFVLIVGYNLERMVGSPVYPQA